MQAKLLERPGLQVLAGDSRASIDLHVRGPRSLPGLTKGVVDAARDKDVRRAAPLNDGLGWTVRDHENRGVESRLLASRADAEVGHAAPDDQCADAAEVVGLKRLGLGG